MYKDCTLHEVYDDNDEYFQEREKNNPMKFCVLKFDHFENIHRLPKEIKAYDGAPNFRQVNNFLLKLTFFHSFYSKSVKERIT